MNRNFGQNTPNQQGLSNKYGQPHIVPGMLAMALAFAMTAAGCASLSSKSSGGDGGKPANAAAVPNAASSPVLYSVVLAESSAEDTAGNWRDTGTGQPSIIPVQVFWASAEQPGQAERIFRAIAEAYPDRVAGVSFRKAGEESEADWAIQIYGEWFYYAGGRFLPASLLNKADEYDPLPFYDYPEELPPWRLATPEESERMRADTALRTAMPAKRSPHFLDALWRSHNRDEAWEHVKQIRFLGKPVLVHYSILTNLSLVEERILRLSSSNTAVRQWINSLDTVECWYWRNIALTESRSYHSYGAAIDLIPKSSSVHEMYWLWASERNSEWWNIPYARRLHPPAEVIKAFESFGFIWGGKWWDFDTMHFEYRPELLIMNGIPRMDLRNLR